MEFNDFMIAFKKNAKNVFENNPNLFLVETDKDQIYETYLNAFPPEKNKVYRTRREYDCSCCKSFIRHFGNVVAIESNKIITFWDFHTNDDTFEPVLQAMSKFVNDAFVANVFVTKESAYGAEKTREMLEDKSIHVWNHFHIDVPKKFVSTSSDSINEIMASYRDVKNVFKRSLEEISKNAVQEILDLIAEGMLYRGGEWKSNLEKFASLQKEYVKIQSVQEKENYCWVKSMEVGATIGKIRNHSIGTLLIDLTNNVDLDEAVRKWEKIMCPEDYKRTKKIHTKKQVESAEKFVVEHGLVNSLGRRHSQISDITINNVLWANRNAEKAMKGLSVFDDLKSDVAINPKTFENIQGVTIDVFLEKMNGVKSFEILLENRNEGNFMSLISPTDKDSETLFKWNNNFSWAYNGNVADSMKQRVKEAGGKIDGVSRFSIEWSKDEYNPNDYDAHCVEPNGNRIDYHSQKVVHRSSGVLDVDITNPIKGKTAVENITHTDIRRIQEGITEYYVHCYNHRGGTSGFDAEIELDGKVYEFTYHKNISQGEFVLVAKVEYTKKSGFKIIESLPSITSSKTIWNLKTNQFIPVSVIMLSPNFWDEQKGIGNKHYFFILANCLNETNPNGFYNEYLKEDLLKHKVVFEALGSKMKVEDSDKQLSGLGFSSTQRNYIIAKVDNQITKIIF